MSHPPPSAAAPARRPPATVRVAVTLMLIIALVELAGMSLGFMAADEMRAEMRLAYSADETITRDDVNEMVSDSLTEGVVLTVLLSGLWIWMAVKFRSGRDWARVTGTVLFVLFTPLLTLGMWAFASGASPRSLNAGEHMPISMPTAYGVMWALALVIVILSWTPSANAHFRKARAHPPAREGARP